MDANRLLRSDILGKSLRSTPKVDTKFLYPGLKESHSTDSVKVASTESRRALVVRAGLRMGSNPNGDSKLGFLGSQKPFEELADLRYDKHKKRDVSAKAGMDFGHEWEFPGSPEAQNWLFSIIFQDELLARGIYTTGDRDNELLEINFNSHMSDVPEEWRKVFCIARGLTCERIKMEGHQLHSTACPTDNLKVTLSYNNELHPIFKEDLPAQLCNIFNKEFNEGKIRWRVKDGDSLLTIFSVLDKSKAEKILMDDPLSATDIYWMLRGTPTVRSLVEHLPEDYTVPFIAVEYPLVTNPETKSVKSGEQIADISIGSILDTQHYEVVLTIEHVGSADEKHDTKTFGSPQFDLDSERQADSSPAVGDVRAGASRGDAGEPTPQDRFRWAFLQLLDNYGYVKETNDPFIYDYVGGDERQAHSLNYDSNVFDVPAEWCEPFLIARGQACERVRMEGQHLHSSVFPTDNRIVTLSYNNGLYEILKDHLSSRLPRIFKKGSNEGMIIYYAKGFDNYYTCINAYQEASGMKWYKNIYNLEKEQFNQKEIKLQKLRKSQREQELKYAQFLLALDKDQWLQCVEALQRDLSQPENIERIQILRKAQDKIKYIFVQEVEVMKREHEAILNQKMEEQEQSKNMQNAYYMILGTPEVRSIIGQLPEDYTIDSMTIEKKFISGSLLPAYKVGLSIKRVDSADKQHSAEE